MIRRTLLAALLVCGVSITASAETYKIDATHSYVGFTVRHMAISKVKGAFNEFEGTIDIDPADTTKWACDVTIQTASIDTRSERRDGHLKSPDFFNAEEFPTITFKSTKVVPKGNGALEIMGDLTMHGVTKPVTLDAEYLGGMESERGKRAGFTATTTIDRMDYGVSWDNMMETGGLVVSHDVDITLEIEASMRYPEESGD